MPKDFFAFKRFSIRQGDNSVMKVNTDSVILGVWANIPLNGLFLDIGCGTGLLTLIIAQKSEHAKVIGIDISSNATECAKVNTNASQYAERIQIIHQSLQNFTTHSKNLFDIVICNPPYFSKSLRSNSADKNITRHHETLRFKELITCVKKLLSDSGIFYVLIPFYEASVFQQLLQDNQLFIHDTLEVFSDTKKELPYIFCYKIQKSLPQQAQTKQLFIKHNNTYTAEYISLTKDFYLFA